MDAKSVNQETVDQLIRQRDALLRTCRRAEQLIDGWCQRTGSTDWSEYSAGRQVRAELRAAIAQAEEA